MARSGCVSWFKWHRMEASLTIPPSSWPAQRPLVEFGTIELNGMVPDGDAAQRQIIFDPIPRVDGIEPSGDPLLDPRASLYLASGQRRRAATLSGLDLKSPCENSCYSGGTTSRLPGRFSSRHSERSLRSEESLIFWFLPGCATWRFCVWVLGISSGSLAFGLGVKMPAP
jgi:hypothetical protein